jgi:hypothetical protein
MKTSEVHEKNDKMNRSLVTFRKTSKEVNNSVIILQNQDVNYSLNVGNNSEFFNKKNVKKNLNLLKQKIPMYSDISNKKSLIHMNINKRSINLTKSYNKDFLNSEENIKSKVDELHERKESKEEYKKILRSEEEEDSKYIVKDEKLFINDFIIPKIVNKQEEKKEDYDIQCIGENQIKNHESEKSYDYVENLTKTIHIDPQELVRKSNTHDLPYTICLFCDNYYIRGNTLSANCSHMFCLKCGKSFYEEKIEEGENQLKCPVYKCYSQISEDVLRSLVTTKHMENYEKTIKKELLNKPAANPLNINASNKAFTINDLSLPKQNSDVKVKMYSQRHVFDITNNDSFRYFSKSKEQFCGRCYEPALFGKNGRKTIKCLNCWFNSCKFCGKENSDDHFNLSSFNYCKIYYRKKMIIQPPNKVSLIKDILIGIVLFILGYFVFLLGFFKHISNFMCSFLGIPYDEYKSDSRVEITKLNILLNTMYLVLMIISIVVILPILLFIFPYFPLIVFLWN